MLDIKFIRQNLKKIKETAKNKNIEVDIEKLLKLSNERGNLQKEIDELRSRRNELARAGKAGKPSIEHINEGKAVKEKIAKLEKELEKIEKEYRELIYAVPNIVSSDTPIGHDEKENKVIKKVGDTPKFGFNPKDHMELGVFHNIIDTEKSAKIAGTRFNYLFNGAVLLQFGLINFTLDVLTNEKIIKKLAKKVGNPFSKAFIPVIVPAMAKSEIMKKMDRFDPIEDRYFLKEDDLLLIGSAEHTLGPLHMDEIMAEKKLPIRYVGYSTAFRREAGSYGKDTAGIFRRHQFDKLEMETFIQPEYGQKEQDLIVAIQEYLVSQLGLPYQVINICTGDMGKPNFKQVDIECWLPCQAKYRETHTSDYMTDYQSRRLNIKYRDKEGKKQFVHMNDATAFAIGRTLIAILENYQQADGSIKVPKILQKYMPGNLKIIKKA